MMDVMKKIELFYEKENRISKNRNAYDINLNEKERGNIGPFTPF